MLRLRDNLHWCDCDGRAVFLDTQADRYFCLPNALNEAFVRLHNDPSQTGLEGVLPLLERGLLIEGSGALRSPAAIDPPSRDWSEQASARGAPAAVARAIVSELRVATELRATSLQQALQRSRALPLGRRRGRNTASLLRRIAAAADSASFILRAHDRCLVRALATHRLCRTSGLPAKLVFGVVAHPFSAHCWVQFGDGAVVGGHEQARLYTPILVVE